MQRQVLGLQGSFLGLTDGEIAPAGIAEKLDEGIEGVGIGEAIVFHFSPDAFECDVAEGDTGLFADKIAEPKEVLVGPIDAVSPACFFFEESYNLRDQCFIGLHSKRE